MKSEKKILSVLLCVVMAFSLFVPAFAGEGNYYTFGEKAEHSFYSAVDNLIFALGKVLNSFIPGLNWSGKVGKISEYESEGFLPGKASFDRSPADGARWSMGFGEASFLDGIDPMDGSFFMAGTLEPFKGRAPTKVLDDQGVNTFAVSDGETTAVFASIDGFAIARGDVIEIRKRLADYADRHGISSINVSALHQHSCIDTLGLAAPLVPAVLVNPFMTTFGIDRLVTGKNSTFMEKVYESVVASVEQAVNGMEKGSLCFAKADVSEFIHDKREPDVTCDDLSILKFVPDNESAREIYVLNFGFHCISNGASSDVLSADIPYYIEQYIKSKANADVVCLQGAELAVSTDTAGLEYDSESDEGRMTALGNAIGERALSISEEEILLPLLNVAHKELSIKAENPVHILAAREGLLSSVFKRDGLGYTVVTEIGYMELGGKVGVIMIPGELEPAILLGGAASAAQSWSGESWDHAPLTETCGADEVLCFGLCNDQIGYILADNDYRSMLTENEEINALSTSSGSAIVEGVSALVEEVKK